jgi:hypothetical protein
LPNESDLNAIVNPRRFAYFGAELDERPCSSLPKAGLYGLVPYIADLLVFIQIVDL